MPIMAGPTPPPAAVLEGFVLDTLDLNTASGAYQLEVLNHTAAKKKQEWVEGADSDGALLMRDPLFGNCTWSGQVRIIQATRDQVQSAIAAISDKLEEAERNEDGIPLVWTPANSSLSLTWYVLSGEIEELPISVESGYFANAPLVSFRFDCKPFGYGAEVLSATATSTTPICTITLASALGDVPS